MAAKMAMSGARGNPSQLGIGTASPLMAFDVKGHPIPVAIKHSFAEGLSPAEFFAMSYGGRASTVLTQLSTEKPGALFKKLTPAMFHEVITMTDCGTKNGIMIPTPDGKAIIGRYEAGTNHLIDEHEYSLIRGKKYIKIRSPMTCEAHEGVCQKCYGIGANGKIPGIGENVGTIAAQSVSEVLTQAMLSTKHEGGVAGGQRNVFEEANNLLSNPKDNFQDEAGIATANGKITKITQTPLKDWEIYIGDKRHFISREQEPVVHEGETVRLGDPLSTGTLNPRKLVELKGAGAGRLYLADKLREVYTKKSPGLDPRHFELIAKNMIKYVEVKDPGESEYLPGQILDVAHIHKYLNNHKYAVPISKAAGKTLATGVLELTPGTHLTANHIDDLHKAGIHTIHVADSDLKIQPIVPGLQTIKLADDNWVSRLSFNRLSKTMQDAAALGLESPIHSTEPITPYIFGTEFGEGEKGRY
jgi:DNA-directed RNA polymerase subunit beta'